MISFPNKTISYFELLRRNPQVRQVWLAQVISELGDWLNFVALIQIISKLSSTTKAVGWLIILQMAPFVIVGPIAGIVADKFSRRHIMIIADLARAVVVLGYLLVDRPERLWLLYVLAGLQFSLAAFFEPARGALIPALAKDEELITTNALSSVTWSMMLAIGGVLGGLITGLVSTTATFQVDAISFIISAILLTRLNIKNIEIKNNVGAKRESEKIELSYIFKYLGAHPKVLAVLLIKTGICITASGVYLLQVIYGQKIFPLGKDGAISVGLLYGIHGLGALVGATLTNRFSFYSHSIKFILYAFIVRSIFFFVWAGSVSIGQVALASFIITAVGGSLWVVSTSLLQQLSTDNIRGRLFALEHSALTFAMAVSTYLVGCMLDIWKFSPSKSAIYIGLIATCVVFAWGYVLIHWSKWN